MNFLFSDMERVVVSVVVPAYNEIAVLDICHQRLRGVMEGIGLPYELLYVDDGSSDGCGEALVALASQDSHMRVIRLSRNFGKEAAITAGLDHARGEAVILIDADLQDPPELIPDMLAAWRSTGADVIAMRRRRRSGESWFKRSCAHLFYRILNRLSEFPIPQDTGDFRLLSRRVVESINRLPERSRYMKGLFAWVGFPTHEILYDREPRAAGRSKWGFFGLLRLALEGVTSFSAAPLRWVTGLGLVTAVSGAVFGLWIVVKTLQGYPAPSGYPSSIAMMTFLGGIQLFSVGLLGEYVGRIYLETKQRPRYLVRDIDEAPGKPSSRRENSPERFDNEEA